MSTDGAAPGGGGAVVVSASASGGVARATARVIERAEANGGRVRRSTPAQEARPTMSTATPPATDQATARKSDTATTEPSPARAFSCRVIPPTIGALRCPDVAQVPDTPLRRVRADGYEIDTDPSRLDRAMIHHFLSTEAYWALGVPRDLVDRSIDHSLNFGLYRPDGRQVGFARVLTDTVVFAYLADVFVLPAERARGLGAFLVATVVSHPDLQRLRRFSLATADAHGLYERFGWRPHPRPQDILEIRHGTDELYGT